MPWCPRCKNEYKKGITNCSDCGLELVETENLEALAASSVSAGFSLPEIEETLKELSEEESADFSETLEEAAGFGKRYVPYQNSAAKAEDNKASAYMLLVFGVAGMVAVVLGIMGILPLRLSGAGKYMTYGIMSALFLLFIVMGLVSMKSYRVFQKKAESENTLRSTIEKWCRDNFTREGIDEMVFGDNAENAEEEKYFKRISYMKEKITEKFLNLDEAFLDNFVDEMYTGIYGE